mmetsp:Transcript_24357/g.61809  ORF Transcript_24357/g.61809 Transcript_24357/m.61809 type:complete len:229 (-) Transcript_24357:278-964(-)
MRQPPPAGHALGPLGPTARQLRLPRAVGRVGRNVAPGLLPRRRRGARRPHGRKREDAPQGRRAPRRAPRRLPRRQRQPAGPSSAPSLRRRGDGAAAPRPRGVGVPDARAACAGGAPAAPLAGAEQRPDQAVPGHAAHPRRLCRAGRRQRWRRSAGEPHVPARAFGPHFPGGAGAHPQRHLRQHGLGARGRAGQDAQPPGGGPDAQPHLRQGDEAHRGSSFPEGQSAGR